VQIIFWSFEGMVASYVLILVAARFQFDSVIYCNFCCFFSIDLFIVISGSFKLRKLVDLVSAHFCLNIAFYFF
jgi:hypothetical protein